MRGGTTDVTLARATFFAACFTVFLLEFRPRISTIGWTLCEYVIVHTAHIVHTILPPSPVILWIELGGKPKWLPLIFGYHDEMRMAPILREKIYQIRAYDFELKFPFKAGPHPLI